MSEGSGDIVIRKQTVRIWQLVSGVLSAAVIGAFVFAFDARDQFTELKGTVVTLAEKVETNTGTISVIQVERTKDNLEVRTGITEIRTDLKHMTTSFEGFTKRFNAWEARERRRRNQ